MHETRTTITTTLSIAKFVFFVLFLILVRKAQRAQPSERERSERETSKDRLHVAMATFFSKKKKFICNKTQNRNINFIFSSRFFFCFA
jgi:hypothetical protein